MSAESIDPTRPSGGWLTSHAAARIASNRDRYLSSGRMHQPPLLSLMLALVAFTVIGYGNPPPVWIAMLDVSWDHCRYTNRSCSFPDFPDVPDSRTRVELEIHTQGYTLRIEPTLDIDIKRKNGALDTSRLEEVAGSFNLSQENRYSRVNVYVESGLPLDDYLRSIDSLKTLHLLASLHLQEPPGRVICLNRLGCVPTPAPRLR